MLRASLDPAEFGWIKSAVSDFGLVKSIVPEGLAAYCAVHHPDGAPGSLCAETLASVCTIVARHTGTPQACYFCLWEGRGWLRAGAKIVFHPIGAPVMPEEQDVEELSPSFREALAQAVRVELPSRRYFLLEGPLAAIREFGWNLSAIAFVTESPNLFWPKDHAWCVATEVDLAYTLVCGSKELIAELIADPSLDVSSVSPSNTLAEIDRTGY